MKKNKYIYILKDLLIILILIAIDQITKYFAVEKLKGKKSFPIIKDIFELEYLENSGAAWGILENQYWVFFLMTIIVLSLLALILNRIYKSIFKSDQQQAIIKHFLILKYILLFMYAGILGNFIDRLRNSYVVDFFYFKLIDFPVFNVADCYLTISTGLLLIVILFVLNDEEYDLLMPFPSVKKGIDQHE